MPERAILPGSSWGAARLSYPAQVRQSLTRLPLAQQIYAKIQQQAGASKLADFSLIRELGNPARTVFASSGLEHTIPGLYTYEGFLLN